MARPNRNLRQRARQQAHAEVHPQIESARQRARAEHRSVNSSVPAMEEGLEAAETAAHHAGLSPHDAQILLKQFANQTADVSASAALQNQQIGQGTQETISGLHQAEGEQTRSIFSQLQLAAQEHAQQVADEQRSNQEGIAGTIQTAELEKQLGLGDYGQTPKEKAEIELLHSQAQGGGLTPTQTRDAAESQETAKDYAHNLVRSVHAAGGVNAKGEQVLPAHPKDWSDQNWAELTEKVAGSKGVNSYKDAEHAIDAIRGHFQPGQTPPANPAQAGAKALGSTIGHAAANPLSAILQFGSSLAR